MLLIISALWICQANALGSYKFYRNHGLTFYDYSGQGYHGYNGNSPKIDEQDGIITDRGIYFGGSTYATLHSNHWNDPSPFPNDWHMYTWVYFVSDGVLFSRQDTEAGLTYAEASVSAGVVQFSTTLSILGIPVPKQVEGSTTMGEWVLLAFQCETGSLSKFIKLYAGTATYSEVILLSKYTEPQSTFETLLGTADKTTSIQAFVYLAEFVVGGEYSPASLMEFTCIPFNGQTCSSCPLEGTCLSTNLVPTESANGTACSDLGCDGGCSDTECLSCAFSDWPTCDLTETLPEQCDPSCSACFGPTSSECLSCPVPFMTMTGVEMACVCEAGYIEVGGKCIFCPSDCATCVEDGVCETCVVTHAFPDQSGSCYCAEYATLIDTECVCDSGYYMDTSSLCQGPDACTACRVTGAVPTSNHDSMCSCPENSEDTGSQCECSIGFFEDTGSCVACPAECSECAGSDACITCAITGASPNSNSSPLCVCPENMEDTGNQCECVSGFYEDTGSCVACAAECSECSGPNACIACAVTGAIPTADSGSLCICPDNMEDTGGQCECVRGLYENAGSCVSCPAECSECSGPDACTTCAVAGAIPAVDSDSLCVCAENMTNTGSQCVCIDGYYSEAGVCLECDSTCQTCAIGHSCVTCKDSNAELTDESTCECPENSTFDGFQCVCIEGYEWNTQSECILSSSSDPEQTDEESYNFDDMGGSMTQLASHSATVSMSVSLMIIDNPSTIWLLFSSVQLFSFIPLLNLSIPKQLQTVLLSFDLSNFFPNIVILLTGIERGNTEFLPSKWLEVGWSSTNFFDNSGSCIFCILLLACWFCVCLLGRFACSRGRLGSYFQKKLSSYRYNTLMGVWVQLYIEILAASIVCFASVVMVWPEPNANNWNQFVGAVFFLSLIATPLVCYMIARFYYYSNSETEKRRVKTLVSGFVQTDLVSLCYYVSFTGRRLLYVLSLYLLGDYPYLQLSGNIILSVLMLSAQWNYFKSASKFNQRLSYAIELVFILTLIGIGVFQTEDGQDRGELAYVLIGLIASVIGAIYFKALFASVARLCSKCRRSSRYKRSDNPSSISLQRNRALSNNRSSISIVF